MKNPKHAQAAPLTAAPDDGDVLVQRELKLGAFPDERLGERLGRLLGQFVDGTAESVPLACQEKTQLGGGVSRKMMSRTALAELRRALGGCMERVTRAAGGTTGCARRPDPTAFFRLSDLSPSDLSPGLSPDLV